MTTPERNIEVTAASTGSYHYGDQGKRPDWYLQSVKAAQQHATETSQAHRNNALGRAATDTRTGGRGLGGRAQLAQNCKQCGDLINRRRDAPTSHRVSVQEEVAQDDVKRLIAQWAEQQLS